MSDMCKSAVREQKIVQTESNDQSLEIVGKFCYLVDTIGDKGSDVGRVITRA